VHLLALTLALLGLPAPAAATPSASGGSPPASPNASVPPAAPLDCRVEVPSSLHQDTLNGITLARPELVHDGQLLVVEVRTPRTCPAPGVGWMSETFKVYPTAEGKPQALLPVRLGLEPGTYKLTVTCGTSAATFDVPVGAGTYPESRLSVDPKFTSVLPPPRVAQERAAIEAAFKKSEPRRLWSQGFVKPTAGEETSPFGVRRTFNGSTKSRHMGEDFDGKVGDALWASNDGIVVLAAKDFFYVGNAAFIDHGDHLYTMYFHMSELKVQTGDRVVRGQLLGVVGSTGRATGPHVHFGIKLAGTYINPADLLTYQPGAVCASKE
jgi:hypothetical protein